MDCKAVGILKQGDNPNEMTKKKFREPVYTIIDSSSPTINIAASYFEIYIEEIFS